jgi:hypothetical protein
MSDSQSPRKQTTVNAGDDSGEEFSYSADGNIN